jgi:hypothetical protein
MTPSEKKTRRKKLLSKSRQKAKEYVKRMREVTVCDVCGKQPIEWHNDAHLTDRNRRIAGLSSRNFAIRTIQREIYACQPLCRSCHMKMDGRMGNLRNQKKTT